MHNPDYTPDIFITMRQREIERDVAQLRLVTMLKRTGRFTYSEPQKIMKSIVSAIFRRRIAPLATPTTSPMMVKLTEKIKDNDQCCPNPV